MSPKWGQWIALGWFWSLALCGAAELSEHASQSDYSLKSRISKVLEEAGVSDKTQVGLVAQSLNTREILVNIDGSKSLHAGATTQLFTTAAGIFALPDNYTWKTEIAHTGTVREGVLKGDLVLIGYGDPTLGGRFHPQNPQDVTWVFRTWANRLRKQGVRKIHGDIIGDDDWFDDQRVHQTWSSELRGDWTHAEISALSFNDACVDIRWRGAKKTKKPPTFTLNPPTKYTQIHALVRSIPEKQTEKTIRYFRKPDSDVIRAEGSIRTRGASYGFAAIHNPTLYTATVLKEALEEAGIEVRGRALDVDDVTSKGLLRKKRKTLWTHRSPPLSKIIQVLNGNGQNLYAELLFRTLGREHFGEGSFQAGSRAVEKALAKRGLYRTGFIGVDGSGLSYLNRVSPRMVTETLYYMENSPYRTLFRNSLRPTTRPGSNHNTEPRSAPDSPSKRVLIKTGSFPGGYALNGYIDGEPSLAFSLILNGADSQQEAKNLGRQILQELAFWNTPKSE